jgi:uncharacterized protein YcnI
VRRALLGISGAALMVAAPASAHVTVKPGFIAADDEQQLVFSAPNERQAPMTGFSVLVPKGFRIVEAGHQATWHPVVLGSKVTWSGGSLPAGQKAKFTVDLRGPSTPGAVELDGQQLYASGAVVRWPVAFTVIPGTQPSQHLGLAAVVAVAGLLVTALFVLVTWRRRVRSRPEG